MKPGGIELGAMLDPTESMTCGQLWKMRCRAMEHKDVGMKCRRGWLKARTPPISAGRLKPATTQNQNKDECLY
jgi:hypothetical protein